MNEVTQEVAIGSRMDQQNPRRFDAQGRFDQQMPRQRYNEMTRSRQHLDNEVKRRRFNQKPEEEGDEKETERRRARPIVSHS